MARRINYKSPMRPVRFPDEDIENAPVSRDRQFLSKAMHRDDRHSERPYYEHNRGDSSGLESIENVMDSRAYGYGGKSNKSAET